MNPSDYTVQEHIVELRRVAAQQRLAREVRAHNVGSQPIIVVQWLNRLFAALRRHDHPRQPELKPTLTVTAKPGATLPELYVDEAWC